VASRIITFARAVDDFIIDRALQPGVDLAAWYLNLPVYTLARVCMVLGAGTGLIWLHRFDSFPSLDFYEDTACLGIMVLTTFTQIRSHEARAPKRPALMPAVRATGLFWRSAWLLDFVTFPTQWPVEAHAELTLNFLWTFLIVLPYWLICCRLPPPPIERRVGALTPATIPVR
jgi:hypothetical protein